MRQDPFSIINSLPDAVLVLSRNRGKIIEANNVFLEQTGFTKERLINAQPAALPLFSPQSRRGLLRLFIHALRDTESKKSFRFQHVSTDKIIRDLEAVASRFTTPEEDYVVFTFREVPGRENGRVDYADIESWESYLNLAGEPYLEFRPAIPLLPPLEVDDRISFLKLAGGSLRVRYANRAAMDFFSQGNGSLEGRTFSSFFNNGDDAFRFLDMLSVVGQMKAETAVTGANSQAVQVEMNCMVRFEKDGTIAAVYCSQRDLSGYRHYEAVLGGSRIEMDFTFNQPFIGLAFLSPSRPLERSGAEHADDALDAMLDQILIVRANHAMLSIHGMDKTQFLMKPMMDLFPDRDLARRILRELFVTRVSSAAVYDDTSKETFRHVSIFRSTFDDADRMNGILVATSKYENGFQARHNNQNG